MLETVLRLLGIDLQQQIFRLKQHVGDVTEQTSARIERQIQELALTLGLALAGLIAALATAAIVLTAIFIWLDREHGPLVGLAVVGVITAVLAGLLFTLAGYSRTPRDRGARPAPPTAPAPPLEPPPAAAVLDDAINTASELLRTGSRDQLVGTLTLALVIGILIGRKP